MTDAATVPASKPYLTSTTILSGIAQLIVSLTAVLALLMPKHADQIANIGQMVTNYLPMVVGIAASLLPFIGVVIGRAKATTALH